MLEEVLDNLPVALAAALGLIGLIVYMATRQRDRIIQERVKRCAPLAAFLKEISKDDLDERRMKMLFEPRIFQEVEVATLKTMCRCVKDRLGNFIRIVPASASLSIKKDSSATDPSSRRYAASATCEFAKHKNVKCEVSWKLTSGSNTDKNASNTVHVVSFSIKPAGQELDILEHVEPTDFERFGEKFVERLLSKNPKAAMDLMHPPLAAQFSDPAALTEQVKKVMQSIGGFKDREFDIGLSDARCITVGPEGHQRKAIELEYVLLGNIRDTKVKVAVVFSGVKTHVLRYTFTGLPVKQKTVFVDESGRPV